MAIGYLLSAISRKSDGSFYYIIVYFSLLLQDKSASFSPMAAYQKFEDLPVWRQAAQLYNLVLDLFEEGPPISSGYRNQLDRAALSVSNNIAEGFERATTRELLSFLAIASGSAGEVRSMLAVVKTRSKLRGFQARFREIAESAESCSRQICSWIKAIEESPVQGLRHRTPEMRARREQDHAIMHLRTQFLLSIGPEHPLFDSPAAKEARRQLAPRDTPKMGGGPAVIDAEPVDGIDSR